MRALIAENIFIQNVLRLRATFIANQRALACNLPDLAVAVFGKRTDVFVH